MPEREAGILGCSADRLLHQKKWGDLREWRGMCSTFEWGNKGRRGEAATEVGWTGRSRCITVSRQRGWAEGSHEGRTMCRRTGRLRGQGQRAHLLTGCFLELKKFREDKLVSFPCLLGLLSPGTWEADEASTCGVLRANLLLGNLTQSGGELLSVLVSSPSGRYQSGCQDRAVSPLPLSCCSAQVPLLSCLSPPQNPGETLPGLRTAYTSHHANCSHPSCSPDPSCPSRRGC